MAKGDREKVNKDITGFQNTVKTNLATNTALNNEQGRFATTGYEDIYSRGGVDPTVVANLRALNRNQSSVYSSGASSGGGGGEESGGGGTGTSSAPSDPFATSRAAFQNFINSGGVDIGAMKEALGGYRKISESGGYDPADVARIKGGIGRLEEMGKTGGYSPQDEARIRGSIGRLEEIGKTGGISEVDRNRARGLGVYDEFARTGGWSPADIQNYRARATAAIPALYETDRNAIERSNRLLGQANPGYGATLARLGRNRGMALADATRNAEVDLQSQIREGRLAGAEGAATTELALQQLITANQISGNTQASRELQGLVNSINNAKIAGDTAAVNALTNLAQNLVSNQLTALGGITTTQQGAEEIAQRGKIAGAQGMFGVESATEQARMQAEAIAAQERAASEAAAMADAAARAGDERFWAQFNAGNEQWIGGTGLEGQLAALGGLGNLYGTAPGAQGQDYNAFLNATGMKQANIGPSIMDRIMQGASMAAPVIGMFGGMPSTPKTGGTYGPTTPTVTGNTPWTIPSQNIPGWNRR